MKKLITLLCALFIMSPAFADNKAVVQCLNSFSTDNPSSYFNAKVVEKAEFDNGVLLEKNAIIRGKVLKVVDAKRAKRNAYFVIIPVAYTSPSNNKVYKIKDSDWQARVAGYKPFDIKDTAESAGVTVANFFVKNIGTVYYFGKGFVKPKGEDGRLKSGVKEAYENSFLSYIEEGESLTVNKGDYLLLVFYHNDVPKWKFWERNR